MSRVSAGSVGPGIGCTCMSSLKPDQILTAMVRASEVQFIYRRTEPDGTLVFKAWTYPESIYTVTYNPSKQSYKLCKHTIAASAYIVGPWLTKGLNQLRKEMDECLTVRKELYKLQKDLIAAARAMARLSHTS